MARPPSASTSADELRELRKAAEVARSRHYAPYSGYLVVAAVRTCKGIFGGSNIEIANYSLTKHAEEAAMMAAINAGVGPQGEWLEAVYIAGGAPCGSCRQFMHEFGRPDTVVLLESLSQAELKDSSLEHLSSSAPAPEVWQLRDLLPLAFSPVELGASADA